MKKALAQNPNLLRTLLGLSVTLILLLSYAVYGATVSPSYYLYDTNTQETVHVIDEPIPVYQESTNIIYATRREWRRSAYRPRDERRTRYNIMTIITFSSARATVYAARSWRVRCCSARFSPLR